MRLKYSFAIIIVAFVFVTSCGKNDYIDDYGKYLEINFPKGIEMIHMKSHSDFQDFSNFSIYNLSNAQKDDIIKEIIPKLCDSVYANKHQCWEKSGNFYYLKLSDSILTSQYYIKAIITAENDINTLMIYEVKL